MSETVQRKGEAEVTPATDLCSLDELRAHELLEISVGRRRLAVAYVDGEVFVFNGTCPHRGGPLGQGKLTCVVTSNEVHERILEATRPILVCPWHGWEFSLTEGRALTDPRMRLRRYPTTIRDGRVLAQLRGSGVYPKEGEGN